MPEEAKKEEVKEEVKKEEKTVDIDTSGPDVDVKIPEEKVQEEVEVKEEPKEAVQEPRTTEQEPEVKVEEKPKEEPKDEKKEELEEYSQGVQKRIAKLTKKWREAERQKEAALDYAKGVQRDYSDIKTKLSRLEPNYVTAIENRVTSGLQAAQAKLVRAREAGDINAEVDAQKEIARLGVEEVKVNTLKSKLSDSKEKEVKTPSLDDVLRTPPADPKAEAWAEKNEWFGKDSAMTYTAFDYHKKLTEDEGMDPKSDEYYAEIDKRMRLDFPHRFGKTESKESTKPTQTVASATRSVRPSRSTVRLTSSQVAIAKKLGVPLEEYAKQLKITKEAYRWIRAESMGFDDTKNMAGKLRSGYELVRADEYPGSNYPVMNEGKYKGIIGVGGLLLARIPIEVVKSRDEYFNKITQDKDTAVEQDLMKEQHPSMPINAERQTRVTFGGTKKS